MTFIAWVLLQITIIGSVVGFAQFVVTPTMPEPVGIHVPFFIGIAFAAAATYAISDLIDLWRRRRDRNRKF